MKKNLLFFIVIALLVAFGGYFLLKFFFKGNDLQRAQMTARSTPPPTRPIAKTIIDNSASGLEKLSFPSYNVTLMVPSDLKNHKDVDPKAEDTEIGSNFVALYTPKSVFDPKKHIQTAGVKFSINIINSTKNDFTDEKDIIPTSSIKEATEDTSVFPDNNTLLNKKTLKVYSFPLDRTASTSAWAYNAEVLLHNGGNMLDISLYCVDYSSVKNSPACQKLLTDLLSTLQR